MWQLNLPAYQFYIKPEKKTYFILDEWRKKYVKLTPEEWVRQNFLKFLTEEKGYPSALIAVETQLKVNKMVKRCDAVLYNLEKKPEILLEFKSLTVNITQQTFDQTAVYNSKLNLNYFIISNGLQHYFCKVNTQTAQYEFFNGIPTYEEFRNQQFPNR